MNNKEILFKGDEKWQLELAMQLAFNNGKAAHYSESDDGFSFYWSEDKSAGSVKLPMPMASKAAADMIWEWLLNFPKEKRAEPFGGDGSEGLGFKLYVKNHCGWSYEICTIQPIWAWYGK